MAKHELEQNLQLMHELPIGSLVEILDEEDSTGMAGVRLFIFEHTRDCDGTPLYWLSSNPPYRNTREECMTREGGRWDVSNLRLIHLPS